MTSERISIVGARVVTPEAIIEDGVVVLGNGGILAVERTKDFTLLGSTVVDASGLTLLPGFLDVHIHGGGRADTMDATPEALQAICRTHARHGTTGLLLTTITQSREKIGAALAAARDAVQKGIDFCPEGSTPLGVHLEGPYICPTRAGAQPKEFVRDYDVAEFSEWLEIAAGTMKLITLAPERPNADALIAAARAAGIVVTMGHTDADAEQTETALDAGVSHATHLFNAMPALHHRKPGPIAPLLTDPRVIVEIIADGYHLAPEIVRLVVAAKGAEGVALITDAMEGAGAGDGEYGLGGHAVTVKEGKATLPDGTLAGSVLTMDRAAANVRAWAGASWEAIARMTSGNVAQEMGWSQKGRISPGADADFVLVDDALTVQATYIAGRCVYQRLETEAGDEDTGAGEDAAYSLRSSENTAARAERLEEPRIKPLSDFVRRLRSLPDIGDPEGVPWFDPADAGINAQVLLLLEAPGGRSVSSGFVSSNNPDPTARNLWDLRDASGLRRDQTLIWNIVPWYVGETDWSKIRGVEQNDIELGTKYLQKLLELLPNLRVIVTLGAPARAGWQKLPPEITERYHTIYTWHPSAQSLNPHPERKEAILQALKDAKYALKRPSPPEAE
ncbi:MAG: N-acetylglucosamine-6-phosphate deacetylase [Armatimonadota bacterium]